MQMETTSVNTKISTQTEDIKTTKDKCVASTLKYKNKKNAIQGWAHPIQPMVQPITTCSMQRLSKWKYVKSKRDKSIGTNFSFRQT